MKEENDVKEIVQNHETRISELENHRAEQEKINSEIRNQLTTTENTVLKESGKQQELTQRLLDHVLLNDVNSRKSYRQRKSYSQQQFWKVVGILAGSSGLLYLLVESIFNK